MYGGSRAYVAHHMRQWDARAKTLQAAFLEEVGPDFPLPWPTTGANPTRNVRGCSRVLYLQLVRAYAARRLTLDIVPANWGMDKSDHPTHSTLWHTAMDASVAPTGIIP